jgi:hypothetical protein
MNPEMVINQEYERNIVEIIRVLPPSRAEQLLDFARFLEAQLLSEDLFQEESVDEINADNARWDALFESEEGQALLEHLAHEAKAEYLAGRTRSMTFNDEGRLAPG